MNVALTTSQGRMAPCFPGVELRVVVSGGALGSGGIIETRAWHPLIWGRELMQRNVGVLLCAGIDRVVWAGIRGYGITVVPNAIGEPGMVLDQWLSGQIAPPQPWQMAQGVRGRGQGRGRRFRGGRG